MREYRKGYDPGVAGEVISMGKGQYRMESFRTPGKFYSVDLNAQKCECPDHRYRQNKCKHLEEAETIAFMNALDICRSLTREQLLRQAEREDLRPEIKAAIETALNARDTVTAE